MTMRRCLAFPLHRGGKGMAGLIESRAERAVKALRHRRLRGYEGLAGSSARWLGGKQDGTAGCRRVEAAPTNVCSRTRALALARAAAPPQLLALWARSPNIPPLRPLPWQPASFSTGLRWGWVGTLASLNSNSIYHRHIQGEFL